MIIPRNLSLTEQKRFKNQIKYWHHLLESVTDLIGDYTKEVMNLSNQMTARNQAIIKIWLMINSSFRSITVLNLTGHFSDSFSILRILFESHLHLWNIINGDEEQAKKFLDLSVIQDWRLSQEIKKYEHLPELDNYFRNDFDDLRNRYEEALSTFKSKPGKILRNYTTVSNEKLASLIDQSEKNNEPAKSFMFIRLYSSGSESIHRSYLGFVEGFASVAVKHGNEVRKVLIPSPARGIETAWWASLIILDSIRWTAKAFKLESFIENDDIRSRIANLAYHWAKGELK